MDTGSSLSDARVTSMMAGRTGQAQCVCVGGRGKVILTDKMFHQSTLIRCYYRTQLNFTVSS